MKSCVPARGQCTFGFTKTLSLNNCEYNIVMASISNIKEVKENYYQKA